jgi:hypothetical protein
MNILSVFVHLELFDRVGEVPEILPGLCDNEFRNCLRLKYEKKSIKLYC